MERKNLTDISESVKMSESLINYGNSILSQDEIIKELTRLLRYLRKKIEKGITTRGFKRIYLEFLKISLDPSNATRSTMIKLANRAHKGVTDRQVDRDIRKLRDSGLIQRSKFADETSKSWGRRRVKNPKFHYTVVTPEPPNSSKGSSDLMTVIYPLFRIHLDRLWELKKELIKFTFSKPVIHFTKSHLSYIYPIPQSPKIPNLNLGETLFAEGISINLASRLLNFADSLINNLDNGNYAPLKIYSWIFHMLDAIDERHLETAKREVLTRVDFIFAMYKNFLTNHSEQSSIARLNKVLQVQPRSSID